MTREYRAGDMVTLLQIPDFEGPTTTWSDGRPIEDIGQVHEIDRVRKAADGGIWYDVAGWCVQAGDIDPADSKSGDAT